MFWTLDDTWTVVIGSLAALACTVPGAFLVTQRNSMLADAISHAVLPGLVVAYMLRGFHDPLFAILISGFTGVGAVLAIETLTKRAKVDNSAAIGVVFTAMFALGLLLIRIGADQAHLDPDHVLFGQLELMPLFRSGVELPGIGDIPRAVLSLAAAVSIELTAVLLFWRPLVAASFDPVHAELAGMRPGRLRLLLLVLTALGAVAAFEAVGSVLTLSMFAVPAVTATLWTTRMAWVFTGAAGLGVFAIAAGHLTAITVPSWMAQVIPALADAGVEDTNSAGGVATVAGLAFAASVALRGRWRS